MVGCLEQRGSRAQLPGLLMGADELHRLRVPPHSIEAEQSVLGSLLTDNACHDKLQLRPQDFYRASHRVIFEEIQAMVAAHKPADVVTVHERLKSRPEADHDDEFGMQYLNALALSVPSASNAARYAELVAEKSARRQLIAALENAAAAAWGPDETGATIAKLGDDLAALSRSRQRVEPKVFRELVAAALDRYQSIDSGKVTPGMGTGMLSLDRLLGGGLKAGKLYGIAARPSVGKSSVARAVAVAAAQSGRKVLLCSQEMPQDEVADCLIAQVARVDGEKLQSGGLNDDDWARLADALDLNAGMPLMVDEQGGLTIHDIGNKARGIKGLDLLVIDYLQLCSSTLKGKSTNDEVAEISKGLKQLAMALRIPVIVLSQLNREVEKRVDKEPQLADLRDSGAIEQDLDTAILLWTVQQDDDEDWRTVGFKIAKNRGGKLGRFAMRFVPSVYGWYESSFPVKPEAPRRGSRL